MMTATIPRNEFQRLFDSLHEAPEAERSGLHLNYVGPEEPDQEWVMAVRLDTVKGQPPINFVIQWEPQMPGFGITRRETDEPLKAYRTDLRLPDIKSVVEWVFGPHV